MSTFSNILNGRQPGGKAVNGVDPALTQQEEGQAATGIETATEPVVENTQNNTTETTPNNDVVSVPNTSPNEAQRKEATEQLSQVQSITPQVDATKQTIPDPNAPKTYTPDQIAAYMLQQYAETPQQAAERQKREKQEKMWAAIGDGLGAVINLAFAPATGYSNYDARNSMSDKARRRWDKITAERNANSQRWLTIYDRAKAREDQRAQWKEQMAYRKEQDALARKDKEEDRKYRAERDAKADELRAQELAYKKERDAKADEWKDKEFKEKVRLNNENIKLSRARLSQGQKSKYSQFYVDGEMLNIPNDALNDQTVTAVFSALPEDVQKEAYATYGKRAKGQYGYSTDGNGNPLYEPLTSSQMLQAIGAYSDDENVANMLRVLAGKLKRSGAMRNSQSDAGGDNGNTGKVTPPGPVDKKWSPYKE